MPPKSRDILALAITSLFFFFPISLAMASTLMAVITVLWLATGRIRERWVFVRDNPLTWAAMALYGLVILGSLYSPANWQDISPHLTKYIKLPFAILLMSAITTERLQQRCMNAFVLAMSFVLASTWLNVWWDLPWSKTQNQGWNVSHHVFGDYITQNIMMAFLVLIALYRMLSTPMSWRKGAWAAMAALASVSITHLSEGRTGYVLLCVVFAVFAATTLRGSKLWIAATLGTGLVVGVLASSGLVRERFILAYEEVQGIDQEKYTSIGNRVYLYKITPLLIAEKPILGHGTGAYHSEICRFVDIPEGCHGWIHWHPHNQFLYFAADHGLLGLAVYLFMLASMVWLARKAENDEARVLLIGLAALLAADSMTNSPLWSARESHFFVYMMALLAARATLRRQSAHESSTPVQDPSKPTQHQS